MSDLQKNNQDVLDSLTKGDLVVFQNEEGSISHWAVYVGDKKVIHLVVRGLNGFNSEYAGDYAGGQLNELRCASVEQKNFWDIAKNCKAVKNNNTEDTPDDPEDVVLTATAMIGPVYCNEWWKSDKEFALFCKYEPKARGLPGGGLLPNIAISIPKRVTGDKVKRFVREHNKKVLKNLRSGDLIEFVRPSHRHWAVYIGGNDELIHYANGFQVENPKHLCTFCGDCSKAVVRKDKFWTVAGNCKAYRNNKDRAGKKPRKATEIVAEANRMLGNTDYNLVSNNCEHFATGCRYGIKWSDQVIFLYCISNVVGICLTYVLVCILKEKEPVNWSGL